MVTSIRATLKRKFLAGLIVSIPAVITVLVIVWFFEFVDGILGPIYNKMLGYNVHGLGFISAVILIFLIGIISTNVFGKKVIEFFEKAIVRIPVFKGIYTAIKQLVDAFSPENNSSFKKFVIVEYPRQGTYTFGFLIKECTVKTDRTGKELCLRAVYIPTNHLYLGDIVLFNEGDVFYTDIPIEEGIRIMLSGGIATPSMISESKE
ncbi:MAG: DUF502 domain-containing protein [Thermodesulfovibrionales bacterium]|nr:DUF502 domain-containing protein [Nitrospinota bacterium]MCG2709510.1 DUF502 domain-containing protein [Thermodesulfovibrionales bacterium]MCG2813907.1 DUF502 domain-containing protein [Thermodesulfovibrionales bacterium]